MPMQMPSVCPVGKTTTIVRLVAQIMKKCQWRVGEKDGKGILEGGLVWSGGEPRTWPRDLEALPRQLVIQTNAHCRH